MDRLAELLTWPEVSYRRMMGADCFLVSGRMFVFFPSHDSAVFKLAQPERQRILALAGAGPFTMNRAVFGSWVRAPLASLDNETLIAFAGAACDHVRTLPPAKPHKKTRTRPLDKRP